MYIPRHERARRSCSRTSTSSTASAGTSRARRRSSYPLLLHYHPLELYRHQVIKQTDVVLATYLVGEHVQREEKRRTFDYYDPLTTGDSTLSACIQSVMASEVGYPDAALEYFLDALRGRPARPRRQHRRRHPRRLLRRHLARARRRLRRPARLRRRRCASTRACPPSWERLRFRVQMRGQLVEVDMTPAATTYRLLDGPAC